MGLDSFIDDAKEDTELDSDSFGSSDNPVCPSCGKEGESTEYWYDRCTTPMDECETVTFI